VHVKALGDGLVDRGQELLELDRAVLAVQLADDAGLPHVRQAQSTGGVTVVAADPPSLFSREADTPPFWAGALILNGTGACSTGSA
jgi:hypothetical protein